jgi:hypothetical protein
MLVKTPLTCEAPNVAKFLRQKMNLRWYTLTITVQAVNFSQLVTLLREYPNALAIKRIVIDHSHPSKVKKGIETLLGALNRCKPLMDDNVSELAMRGIQESCQFTSRIWRFLLQGNINSLQKVELRYAKDTLREETRILMEQGRIQEFSKLKALTLIQNRSSHFAELLEAAEQFSDLCLADNNLQTLQLKSLLQKINPQRLRSLNLNDNMMGAEAVNTLIERLLTPQSSLESLSLKNTNLQNSLAALPALVNPPDMQFADLSFNLVTFLALESFFEAVHSRAGRARVVVDLRFNHSLRYGFGSVEQMLQRIRTPHVAATAASFCYRFGLVEVLIKI